MFTPLCIHFNIHQPASKFEVINSFIYNCVYPWRMSHRGLLTLTNVGGTIVENLYFCLSIQSDIHVLLRLVECATWYQVHIETDKESHHHKWGIIRFLQPMFILWSCHSVLQKWLSFRIGKSTTHFSQYFIGIYNIYSIYYNTWHITIYYSIGIYNDHTDHSINCLFIYKHLIATSKIKICEYE